MEERCNIIMVKYIREQRSFFCEICFKFTLYKVEGHLQAKFLGIGGSVCSSLITMPVLFCYLITMLLLCCYLVTNVCHFVAVW